MAERAAFIQPFERVRFLSRIGFFSANKIAIIESGLEMKNCHADDRDGMVYKDP